MPGEIVIEVTVELDALSAEVCTTAAHPESIEPMRKMTVESAADMIALVRGDIEFNSVKLFYSRRFATGEGQFLWANVLNREVLQQLARGTV